MSKSTADNAGVIIFPPALYAGTLIAGLILHFLFPVCLVPQLIAVWSGITTISVAILIGGAAIRALNRHRTAVNPALPTTAIVSEGVFNFSRNPIYLSFTLLYCGIALLFNSLWVFLLLPLLLIIVHRGIIKREEKYLERKFGDEYLNYKARVRRWF